jgi:hypothetical protein
VVIVVTALVIVSLLFGLTLDAMGITIAFSATLYLFLCLAQALHSLEEYYTQFWMHITEAQPFSRWRRSGDAGPIADRAFFMLFNIAMNVVMFSFYWPVSYGASWSWLFGLGMASVGVANGLLHCDMAIKRRAYFSGCISASLTFVAGASVLASLSIRI